jgi:hypothetical protein
MLLFFTMIFVRNKTKKVHLSKPFLFKFENKNNKMRYLFIILITSISFGQLKPKDLTQLELLHNYEEMIVSTCNYIGGVKNLEEFCCNIDKAIKANSNNETTVKKLYEIFFKAKKWEKREINDRSYLGDGYIENRYIITYNAFKDTIYTSKKNRSIIYKGGLFEYIDEKQEINNALDDELKAFFKSNFIEKKAIVENLKNDSLDVSLVLLNNKNLYKIKINDFENNFKNFTNYITDSTLPYFSEEEYSIEKTYRYFDTNFYFRDEEKLKYFSIKDKIDEDKLKITIDNTALQIGDSLEKFEAHFKNSIQKEKETKKLYNTSKYENYDVLITFKNNKGYLFLIFSPKNELIEINVSYN